MLFINFNCNYCVWRPKTCQLLMFCVSGSEQGWPLPSRRWVATVQRVMERLNFSHPIPTSMAIKGELIYIITKIIIFRLIVNISTMSLLKHFTDILLPPSLDSILANNLHSLGSIPARRYLTCTFRITTDSVSKQKWVTFHYIGDVQCHNINIKALLQ